MRTLLIATLLAACGGPLEEQTEAALGRGLKVRVSDSAGRARGKARFEIDATNTIYFGADVEAGHTVAFEVSEPGGSVWQRTDAPSPRPVTSMPVAGTWIQQYALTGTWSVLVFVDSASVPAGQVSFELY